MVIASLAAILLFMMVRVFYYGNDSNFLITSVTFLVIFAVCWLLARVSLLFVGFREKPDA